MPTQPRPKRYLVEIVDRNQQNVAKLLHRLSVQHREGIVRIRGIIIEGSPQAVGGLNKTVAEIRIKRIKMSRLMIIEVDEEGSVSSIA